ncbi:MAG: hypothetical protein OXB84_05535 [Halobacteriovoraceae bacterium]|nr:hypothetical protein [Halobacteriovoraceae bacterium]
MELIGRVLWWSERDENGIIVDPHGNEFYFDRSVLKLKSWQSVKRNAVVTFYINKSIQDCLCARNIKIPEKHKRKIAEKKLYKELSKNQQIAT